MSTSPHSKGPAWQKTLLRTLRRWWHTPRANKLLELEPRPRIDFVVVGIVGMCDGPRCVSTHALYLSLQMRPPLFPLESDYRDNHLILLLHVEKTGNHGVTVNCFPGTEGPSLGAEGEASFLVAALATESVFPLLGWSCRA